MSELINNARKRKDLLKHMILELHKGKAPEAIKTQLVRMLGEIPYHEVVFVEQELISEGLPAEEVLKFCDIHSAALKGHIDQKGSKPIPPGHPVDHQSGQAGLHRPFLVHAGRGRHQHRHLPCRPRGARRQCHRADRDRRRTAACGAGEGAGAAAGAACQAAAFLRIAA